MHLQDNNSVPRAHRFSDRTNLSDAPYHASGQHHSGRLARPDRAIVSRSASVRPFPQSNLSDREQGGANARSRSRQRRTPLPTVIRSSPLRGRTRIDPSLYPKNGQTVSTLAQSSASPTQDSCSPEPSWALIACLFRLEQKERGQVNVEPQRSVASRPHGKLFERKAGIESVTVPNNGGGKALSAAPGGDADVLGENAFAPAGRTSRPASSVPIAVTGPRRSAFLPSTPTSKNSGPEF